MWLILRFFSAVVFLLSIILSIPIAFDVGGRDSGLAHSLALFFFYFFYSLLRIATPKESRFRYVLGKLVGLAQWVIIPGLLIWSLNRFAVDSNMSGDWVAKTFGGKRAQTGFFTAGGAYDRLTVGVWDLILTYSTPLFQLVRTPIFDFDISLTNSYHRPRDSAVYWSFKALARLRAGSSTAGVLIPG